jgi:hypothetical protein
MLKLNEMHRALLLHAKLNLELNKDSYICHAVHTAWDEEYSRTIKNMEWALAKNEILTAIHIALNPKGDGLNAAMGGWAYDEFSKRDSFFAPNVPVGLMVEGSDLGFLMRTCWIDRMLETGVLE